jgi:Calcineurin-like phosphoesterase/Purple acid Phosphatase, N-terminal domain
MRRARFAALFLFIVAGLILPAPAAQMGVEDTVRATILRLKKEIPADELLGITSARVAELLNDEERRILGTEYLSFQVNVPVTVYVAMDPGLKEDVFWLWDGGFTATDLAVRVNRDERMVWRKDFPKGRVGLGINSFRRHGDHYFAIITPQTPGASVSVTDVLPPIHTVGAARKGEPVQADEMDEVITALPALLEDQVLVRGYAARYMEAHIADPGSSGFFRKTTFPSTSQPDSIAVTMGEDPATSMTVQWRTSTAVSKGIVRYQKKALVNRFNPAKPLEAVARTEKLEDLGLLEDAVVHRHFAALTGLEPGTAYLYSVGGDPQTEWTEFAEFTTAPAEDAPFSFLYMGDIQAGYDRWASVMRRAMLTCPDAAFFLSAGDQVNRGMFRDHWDALFHYADDMFANIPFVPVVGNHEMYKNRPDMYLDMFHLPHNGPEGIKPERAYAFDYGQTLVVVLDTNLPPSTQTAWLEEQLAGSDAVWKFVMYHHPAYSSAEGRDGSEVREALGPIFDKHGVDIAFQGHDHGYLRTYPMKGGQRAGEGDKGTTYLVSFSGQKMYDVGTHDYAEVAFERTPTFQVIDVMVAPHRLVYRAYDVDGNKLDEFVLQK